MTSSPTNNPNPPPAPTSTRTYNAANQWNVENFSGGTWNVYYNQDSPITVNNTHLNQLPREYAQSIVSFAETVNREIQKENIARESAKPLKEDLDRLAEESAGAINKGQVTDDKKKSIRDRLRGVASSLARMSPKIARTVLNFTPLAPFSDLVGEAFENMVKEFTQT